MKDADLPQDQGGSAKPFLDFLQKQRNGLLHDDLTRDLHKLIAAVEKHQKGGKLVLTITVDPINNATGGAVEVSDEIVLKLPKEPVPSSVFFITPTGNLSKIDETQPKLELKEVGSAPAPLKSVGE